MCSCVRLGFGFDIRLRWNTTYLEYVSHSVRVPKNTYTDGVLWNPTLSLADTVNTTEGTYWIAYSSLAPAPTFNGSGTVFTLTFRVKYHPVQPEPDANITLELYSTELAARGGDPIPHYRQNGKVMLGALAASHGKLSQGPSYENNCGTRLHHEHKRYSSKPRRLHKDLQRYTLRKHNCDTNKTSHFGEQSINSPNLHMEHRGFAKGNYTISAYAWPVQGETDTSDNTFLNGAVKVSIPGDVDGDFEVRLVDLVQVAIAYGSTPNQPNWNPNTDIDNNTTGLIDLVLVAIHHGQ